MHQNKSTNNFGTRSSNLSRMADIREVTDSNKHSINSQQDDDSRRLEMTSSQWLKKKE